MGAVNVLNFEHFMPYYSGLNLAFNAVVSLTFSGKVNSTDPD